MWLEPPAFQEELVKSPTFHNFADPIMHNMVVKDHFAWMSLQIIEMDEIGNGEEEQKTIVCGGGGGGPHTAPTMRYSERR